MVERITHAGRLMSVIIRAGHCVDSIEFYTPGDYSQQLACMDHPVGYCIPPHVHNEVPRQVTFTKETIFVRKGRMRIDYYDDNRDYIRSAIVGTGDVILLAYGGHGFEMLEATQLVEVKQGPYVGHEDKVRFESVDRAQVRYGDA